MASPALLPPPTGVERIAREARLPRHRHNAAFVAIVLAGGYRESGDAGRFDVIPGDALVHSAFEAHQNELSAAGAVVLNVPCPADLEGRPRWRVSDPDLLTKLAQRDLSDAVSELSAQATPCSRCISDWPDLLARRLRALEPVRLAEWAFEHNFTPETVSRGFARAYGVSPQRYRAEARGRRAIETIGASKQPLASIAADLGFSDQAHMTRTVAVLSGRTPGGWRRMPA